jgi:hypothetical protein
VDGPGAARLDHGEDQSGGDPYFFHDIPPKMKITQWYNFTILPAVYEL